MMALVVNWKFYSHLYFVDAVFDVLQITLAMIKICIFMNHGSAIRTHFQLLCGTATFSWAYVSDNFVFRNESKRQNKHTKNAYIVLSNLNRNVSNNIL